MQVIKFLLFFVIFSCCGCVSERSNPGLINGVEIKTLRFSRTKDVEPSDLEFIHPNSSFNIVNNLTTQTVLPPVSERSDKMNRMLTELEYNKAIWCYNSGNSVPIVEFCQKYGKDVVRATNSADGKIRPHSLIELKCLSCGYQHGLLYMFIQNMTFGVDEDKNRPMTISYPAYDYILGKCPSCGN